MASLEISPTCAPPFVWIELGAIRVAITSIAPQSSASLFLRVLVFPRDAAAAYSRVVPVEFPGETGAPAIKLESRSAVVDIAVLPGAADALLLARFVDGAAAVIAVRDLHSVISGAAAAATATAAAAATERSPSAKAVLLRGGGFLRAGASADGEMRLRVAPIAAADGAAMAWRIVCGFSQRTFLLGARADVAGGDAVQLFGSEQAAGIGGIQSGGFISGFSATAAASFVDSHVVVTQPAGQRRITSAVLRCAAGENDAAAAAACTCELTPSFCFTAPTSDGTVEHILSPLHRAAGRSPLSALAPRFHADVHVRTSSSSQQQQQQQQQPSSLSSRSMNILLALEETVSDAAGGAGSAFLRRISVVCPEKGALSSIPLPTLVSHLATPQHPILFLSSVSACRSVVAALVVCEDLSASLVIVTLRTAPSSRSGDSGDVYVENAAWRLPTGVLASALRNARTAAASSSPQLQSLELVALFRAQLFCRQLPSSASHVEASLLLPLPGGDVSCLSVTADWSKDDEPDAMQVRGCVLDAISQSRSKAEMRIVASSPATAGAAGSTTEAPAQTGRSVLESCVPLDSQLIVRVHRRNLTVSLQSAQQPQQQPLASACLVAAQRRADGASSAAAPLVVHCVDVLSSVAATERGSSALLLAVQLAAPGRAPSALALVAVVAHPVLGGVVFPLRLIDLQEAHRHRCCIVRPLVRGGAAVVAVSCGSHEEGDTGSDGLAIHKRTLCSIGIDTAALQPFRVAINEDATVSCISLLGGDEFHSSSSVEVSEAFGTGSGEALVRLSSGALAHCCLDDGSHSARVDAALRAEAPLGTSGGGGSVVLVDARSGALHRILRDSLSSSTQLHPGEVFDARSLLPERWGEVACGSEEDNGCAVVFTKNGARFARVV